MARKLNNSSFQAKFKDENFRKNLALELLTFQQRTKNVKRYKIDEAKTMEDLEKEIEKADQNQESSDSGEVSETDEEEAASDIV